MKDPATDRVQAHFDAHAREYVEDAADAVTALFRRKNAFLAEHVAADRPLAVLDVGAGGGIWARLLLEERPAARVVCLDLSAAMLDRIRPEARLLRVAGDALEPPFAPASFDLISVDALMHHLIDARGHGATIDRIGRFLAALRRLLRPDGRIVIREIYHESIGRPDLAARAVFAVSTARLPRPLRGAMRALGIRSQGAGACFLTRAQWDEVLDASGYRIDARREEPWRVRPLRRLFGVNRSGDLFLLVSPK